MADTPALRLLKETLFLVTLDVLRLKRVDLTHPKRAALFQSAACSLFGAPGGALNAPGRAPLTFPVPTPPAGHRAQRPSPAGPPPGGGLVPGRVRARCQALPRAGSNLRRQALHCGPSGPRRRLRRFLPRQGAGAAVEPPSPRVARRTRRARAAVTTGLVLGGSDGGGFVLRPGVGDPVCNVAAASVGSSVGAVGPWP